MNIFTFRVTFLFVAAVKLQSYLFHDKWSDCVFDYICGTKLQYPDCTEIPWGTAADSGSIFCIFEENTGTSL